MSDQAEITLDVHQERVARADAHERLYVVAGPGSGKTETVSARIAHLTEEHGLSGDALLIISFSRAAVEAVQRRQRKNSPYATAWVMTLDSLASRLLTDSGVDTTILSFDSRIERALGALQENPDVVEQWRRIEHLIVDEAQDVVGVRADFLARLARVHDQHALAAEEGDQRGDRRHDRGQP